MDDPHLAPAGGAVNSLLGRLGDVLVEETKLLRGVRRDVQFIRDEIESMNASLIRYGQSNDPQVRAWMNQQVHDVAFDSEYYVDRRHQSSSAAGCGILGHIPRFVGNVATHIRDLQVRTHEVRKRLERRCILAGDDSGLFTKAAEEIIGWMSAEEIIGWMCAEDSSESTIVDRMLAFCYHSFPSHYRNCLAYLAIFPEDYAFKRTTLVRRWLGEGLISRTNVSGDSDLTEVANRCFDALSAHKFLLPAGDIEADTTGGRGRFKKCTVHGGIVRDFLSCIVGDEHVVDAELLPHMDRRISIQNYLLQQSRRNNPSGAIMNHLETLASSLQLLNVLDLEGCSGFTEEKESRYLRIICAKATHLRYLSLRNTGVSQLPRQIQNLQQLETLDIRGTDVRELDDIMLPMLKNLHAGKRESSNRSISTIWLPRNIRMMAKIVVLSHVKYTNSNGDQDQLMKYLLSQIERLHNSLRSLSIRTDGGAHCTADYNPAGSDMLSPPVLLQNLTISGIRGELPNWIGHLRHLAKISLQETYLPDDMLRVLGSLHSLQSLKLLRKALAELTFDFRAGEFMNLVDLLFEEDGWNRIRSVIFDHGTAPMLERVVLRVKKITSIHGIQHLPSLKDLHVIGDLYEVRQVMRDVKQHPNCPRFQY
uniref:Uncharacterized protein n=1 Tax=Oryza glumipatula TaxID=40148 RepID=A0A0E0BLV5_9ORYZ